MSNFQIEQAVKIIKHSYKERIFDSDCEFAKTEIADAIGHNEYELVNPQDLIDFLSDKTGISRGFMESYFESYIERTYGVIMDEIER